MTNVQKTSQAKRLRMDRSKYFSTVHGERIAGDQESQVHFYQDGLPFDAEGFLIIDLVPEEKREDVERRLKKLSGGSTASRVPPSSKTAAPAPSDSADDGDVNDSDDDQGGSGSANGDDVNLEQWLRGERRFQWFAVAAAIRSRYNKNVNNQADAVEFLVSENLVPADNVAESFKKFLG